METYEEGRVVMTTYVLDIETNSLDASIIWCVVLKELNTDTFVIATSPKQLPLLKINDTFITHNGIAFDIPILNNLWKTKITVPQVIDTFIMSRLFNPNREGGHSLASWGRKLAFEKIDFNNFESFNKETVEYCIRDVSLTEKVYNHLLQEGREFSDKSIRLEHNIAYIISQQTKYGFFLDKNKAEIYLKKYNKNAE